MRLFGLTLALLASSLGARAESIEDRMASLEQQVKILQEALRNQGGNGRCASDHFADVSKMVVADAVDAECDPVDEVEMK